MDSGSARMGLSILIFIINSTSKKFIVVSTPSPARPLPVALASAATTHTEHVELVMLLNIAVFSYQFFLQLFQFLAVYLHKSPAFGTNQMVVVFMTIFMLKTLDSITEIDLSANARFAHKPDRSGHRGIADALMLPSHEIIQILHCHVSFSREELSYYLLPLGRLPQPPFGNEAFEFISGIHIVDLRKPALSSPCNLGNRQFHTCCLSRNAEDNKGTIDNDYQYHKDFILTPISRQHYF
jgi:hypothetical protein